MKKILFYVFFFITHAVLLYCNPVKKISLNSKFSTKFQQSETEKNTWKLNNETEMSFSGITAKTAWTSDNVNYGYSLNPHEPAWGIILTPYDFSKMPFYFKFGQLSTSGSGSKLNTGGIGYISTPLTSPDITLQSLTVSMPSAASYNKPFAGNFYYNYKNSNKILHDLKISIFTDEKEKTLFSSSISLNFSKKLRCGISFTTGRFLISSENSSWYNIVPYFPNDWKECHHFQCLFSYKPISCKLNFIIYENGFIYSVDNSFKIKNFLLKTFIYNTSSNQIFTANGNHLKISKQFRINPQFTFFIGNKAKIHSGIIFFAEEKIQTDGFFFVNSALSFSSEFKTKQVNSLLNFKITSLNFDDSFQNIFNNEITAKKLFEKASYNCSITTTLRTKLSPSFIFSYSAAPYTEKLTWKATSKLKIEKKSHLNIKTDFSISTKENDLYDSSIAFSASYSFKQKKLHITAAFSINYDFY